MEIDLKSLRAFALESSGAAALATTAAHTLTGRQGGSALLSAEPLWLGHARLGASLLALDDGARVSVRGGAPCATTITF